MSRINWNVVYEAVKKRGHDKCPPGTKVCHGMRDDGAKSTMDKVKGVLSGKTSRRK